jgi:hypothetical protein
MFFVNFDPNVDCHTSSTEIKRGVTHEVKFKNEQRCP